MADKTSAPGAARWRVRPESGDSHSRHAWIVAAAIIIYAFAYLAPRTLEGHALTQVPPQ